MAVEDPGLSAPQSSTTWSGLRLRSRTGRLVLAGLRAGRSVYRHAADLLKTIAAKLTMVPVPGPIRNAALEVFQFLGRVHRAWTGAVARSPVWRALTNTIWKRILVSNMVGLGVVLIGLLLVSFDSRWVINTRSEALRVQGQIIAAAIAGDLKVDSRRSIIDPDRPAVDEIARIPFRDDGFASLELSIRPERVAPILRRLMEPTDTRARVFARDTTLIVDSVKVLKFNGSSGFMDEETDEDPAERPRWKDIYTRSLHWLIGREVQVYRERDLISSRDYPEVNEAMRGEPRTLLFLNEEGEQIVNVAVPIKRGDTVLGVLLMSTMPGEVDAILADASKGFWRAVLVALLASIASAYLLAQTVAEPMSRLSAAATRVSRDINARTDLPLGGGGSAEVAEMSQALHTMVNALYKRIESSEKFAADVAHELKNPLAAASSTAQCLAYARTEEERAELVFQIEKELQRLNKLITDVSSASRLEAELARQARDPVPMIHVLEGVIDIFRDKSTASHCSVELDVPNDPKGMNYMVSGNGGRLAQVITNLVDNAVSFTPDGGTVRVGMARVGARTGSMIEVCVEDEGPGVQGSALDEIFKRFYTYRPTESTSRGNNSGLGLSISQEIIEAHGGKIWAENRSDDGALDSKTPGGIATSGTPSDTGARFVLQLPAREPGGDGVRKG